MPESVSLGQSDAIDDPGPPGASGFEAVLFDLGRVILRWEPERPFEHVLDPAAVPDFMERVDFAEWNRQMDNGRSFADAEAELSAKFPRDADVILAYRRHVHLAIPGLVPGTMALVAELQQHGFKVAALSNWSADTFPRMQTRFGFLRRFDHLVISGFEGLAKPDLAIYRLACSRSQVPPERTVFIDDLQENIEAALACGITGVRFTDATQLRADLLSLGLPVPGSAQTEPLFHWAVRSDWEAAKATADYPWSTRGVRYEDAGFVRCCQRHRTDAVRRRVFADLPDTELVLLRIELGDLPVLVEEGHPHLYASLPLSDATPTEP